MELEIAIYWAIFIFSVLLILLPFIIIPVGIFYLVVKLVHRVWK